MLVTQILLGASPQLAYSLGLFLEAAPVLAALIYFRWVYLKILQGFFSDMEGRKWLTYIIVTTAVTALVGIPLYYVAKEKLLAGVGAGWLMTALGVAVILNAVLLQKARRVVGLKTFDDMTPWPHGTSGAGTGALRSPRPQQVRHDHHNPPTAGLQARRGL